MTSDQHKQTHHQNVRFVSSGHIEALCADESVLDTQCPLAGCISSIMSNIRVNRPLE